RKGRWNVSIAIRHLYFGQTLRVHDVALFDDAVAVKEVCGETVDFVGCEISLLVERHGDIDPAPQGGCKRPVHDAAPGPVIAAAQMYVRSLLPNPTRRPARTAA